jgi:hypothetical protein
MATTYHEKLISEIREVPDSEIKQFYRVVHTIKEQFLPLRKKMKVAHSRKLGSAKGQIWIADDFNDPLPVEIIDEFYK